VTVSQPRAGLALAVIGIGTDLSLARLLNSFVGPSMSKTDKPTRPGAMQPEGIRVGIIANEFFDPKINRVGGFGWAARRAMDAFRSDPRFATPVFFSGELLSAADTAVDGVRIVVPRSSWFENYLAGYKESIDVFLCIDFRPSYLKWFKAFPRTPVIVWVRDPRTRAAVKRMESLRVPGSDGPPRGVQDWDFHSLSRFARRTRWLRRPIQLACKMEYMRGMVPEVFGLPDPRFVLPNPDIIAYDRPLSAKTEHPRVVSVARLDPVKRPWLFVELARQCPDVEFLMLGRNFVDENLSWAPARWPPNLKMMGNVSGDEKLDLISSSWALINTAIHDESAVSNLEALACETPLISFIESDELATRFGICLGYDTGDGLASLPKLKGALRKLLGDHDLRTRLGRAGRDWVTAEHTSTGFLESFVSACRSNRVAGRTARG